MSSSKDTPSPRNRSLPYSSLLDVWLLQPSGQNRQIQTVWRSAFMLIRHSNYSTVPYCQNTLLQTAFSAIWPTGIVHFPSLFFQPLRSLLCAISWRRRMNRWKKWRIDIKIILTKPNQSSKHSTRNKQKLKTKR